MMLKKVISKNLTVLSICSFVIFTLLAFAMQQGSFEAIDYWVYLQTHDVNEWLVLFMSFITQLMDKTMIVVLSGIVVAVLLAQKKSKQAFLFVCAMAGSAILTIAAKDFFQRPRPLSIVMNETGYSFPSGHALFSVVFFFLTFFLLKNGMNKITKKIALYTATSFVILIGISRIVLGVHWLSDVLAGYALGIFWLAIISRVLLFFEFVASGLLTRKTK